MTGVIAVIGEVPMAAVVPASALLTIGAGSLGIAGADAARAARRKVRRIRARRRLRREFNAIVSASYGDVLAGRGAR